MKNRFGKEEDQGRPHGYQLLLEDMSLNFSDRQAHTHLLRLKGRAHHCPQLDSTDDKAEISKYRILITTG